MDALINTLKHHVIAADTASYSSFSGGDIKTLNGDSVKVTLSDDPTMDAIVMVDDANVIWYDIIASNGIIHAIDTVLIPTDAIFQIVDDSEDFSSLGNNKSPRPLCFFCFQLTRV